MKSIYLSIGLFVCISAYSQSSEINKSAAESVQKASRGVAGISSGPANNTQAPSAFEIKGESRNMDMFLNIDDAEEIEFIKLRENYEPEVNKRYDRPNY